MRVLILILLIFTAPVRAQLQVRGTDAPSVVAAHEPWYQNREPVRHAGSLYYPAGATLFFDGNTMVRTGHFRGVPLYADATVEPYSVVLVPVGRGLMQPYERLRRDALAGTTGSRTPSFPGQVVSDMPSVLMTAIPPSTLPGTSALIDDLQLDDAAGGSTTLEVSTAAPRGRRTAGPVTDRLSSVGSPLDGPAAPPPAACAPGTMSIRPPGGNTGVWITFDGRTWLSHGAPVTRTDEFTQVGYLRSTPVYARAASQDDIVYVPTKRSGVLSPYRLRP